MSVRTDPPASTPTDPDVRSFRVEVAEEDLDDLRRRVLATRWPEHACPCLVYFHEVAEGNHFAAWQEPELFVSEVRDGFRSLR